MSSRLNTKMLVLNAMLIALAAALSYIERVFPIQAIVPIPGLKLGLANVITLFALFYLRFRSTLFIVIARSLLGMLLGGSPMSLAYSLTGALFALLTMLVLKPGYGRFFSLYGISVAGAAAHNIGQVIVSAIILNDVSIFAYLPVLLAGGLVTGILIAAAAAVFMNKFSSTQVLQRFLT